MRPSFVPPQPIRELRDLTRHRQGQIEERAREVQWLEKLLQYAGIKLTGVASVTFAASTGRMLEAMISGTHDPEIPPSLAKHG